MTKRKQEWFQVKMEAVAPAVASEVQLSADIIARIDAILKEKKMTQRDLARKMGKSDAVVSRWTTGFPNLTLRSIAEISTALGEPLIRVTEDTLDSSARSCSHPGHLFSHPGPRPGISSTKTASSVDKPR